MKLHLGCGQRVIPNFVSVDIIAYPHVDYVTDISRLFVFANETVDLIYTCHTLEHFYRRRILNVLCEWRRVLKKGGILRVAVPDFEAICKVYDQTKDINLVIGPLFGRQDQLYNVHYSVFDYKLLEHCLLEAGFVHVERYDWRKTEHCNIDDFSQAYWPHMDKENGQLLSLNVEAIK